MSTYQPTLQPMTYQPTPQPTAQPVAPISESPEISPLGKIIVSACIVDGTARVGLENIHYKLSPWNGVLFPVVTFDPFSTENNNYPALSVKGELSGSNLAITVSSGSDEANFNITPGGAENC